MSNCLPLNAFMSVKPRGKDMPSAKPLRKTTNTSGNSAFGSVKTLDSKGRQTVSLKPRVLGKADQPPHFGSGSVPSQPVDALEKATLMALRHARDDRSNPLSRKVAV